MHVHVRTCACADKSVRACTCALHHRCICAHVRVHVQTFVHVHMCKCARARVHRRTRAQTFAARASSSRSLTRAMASASSRRAVGISDHSSGGTECRVVVGCDGDAHTDGTGQCRSTVGLVAAALCESMLFSFTDRTSRLLVDRPDEVGRAAVWGAARDLEVTLPTRAQARLATGTVSARCSRIPQFGLLVHSIITLFSRD